MFLLLDMLYLKVKELGMYLQVVRSMWEEIQIKIKTSVVSDQNRVQSGQKLDRAVLFPTER